MLHNNFFLKKNHMMRLEIVFMKLLKKKTFLEDDVIM